MSISYLVFFMPILFINFSKSETVKFSLSFAKISKIFFGEKKGNSQRAFLANSIYFSQYDMI